MVGNEVNYYSHIVKYSHSILCMYYLGSEPSLSQLSVELLFNFKNQPHHQPQNFPKTPARSILISAKCGTSARLQTVLAHNG